MIKNTVEILYVAMFNWEAVFIFKSFKDAKILHCLKTGRLNSPQCHDRLLWFDTFVPIFLIEIKIW